MSAATLRKAAALMRERAEAATPGPWRAHETSVPGWAEVLWDDPAEADPTYEGTGVASTLPDRGPCVLADAAHIASWHPAVALAVANWLDSGADQHPDEDDCYTHSPPNGCYEARHALAVARAYLGEQP